MNERLVRGISDFIFMQDEPQKADVIFIPGGSHAALAETAARLYGQGYSALVMPSGKTNMTTGTFAGVKGNRDLYDRAYDTEWAFLRDVLMHNGVPDTAILREDRSRYTKENADFSRMVADENGIRVRRAILCCKNFHARRAYMYYQMAFPETRFYVKPVPYKDGDVEISRENWHRSEAGVRRVMGELERCGGQLLQAFMEQVRDECGGDGAERDSNA